jgi:hypothetical protein
MNADMRFAPCVSPLTDPEGWPDRCLRDIVDVTSDSKERTGIRYEKERVYGYSGGAKALPDRPLAPASDAPIRGSRR